MTRLDFLLDNLTAAVERRRRLEDIERDRYSDFELLSKRAAMHIPHINSDERMEHMDSLDAYQQAKERRQAADKSVLAIAEDIALERREL